jgi:hypothetical protein
MVRGKQQAGILAVSALVAAVIVIAGAMAYLSRGLPRDPAEALRFAGPDLNFVMRLRPAFERSGDRAS